MTESLETILAEALRYSRNREYRGYDKADGMSSKILQAFPVENKWLNLSFQESIKRAPINLRPFLMVTKRRNFKGMSLFACANTAMWDLSGKEVYRKEAMECLDWLIENGNQGYAGFCGGHLHPVQGLNSKVPPKTPGIVGTSYAVRALLRGGQFDERHRKKAKTASKYLFNDLDYCEISSGARIKYKPTHSGNSYTLNANALGARMLVDIFEETKRQQFAKSARNILNYVASNQTESGGWEYRDPPSASHLGMDNYHNGFIIESFLRYQEVIEADAFTDTVEDALAFYREVLYDDNGAPCWDESSTYPRDTHAAAQGIIVFTHTGNLKFARRIIDWTINNLYAGNGRFYYQKKKYYTKRFTLMRWCQAWMSYAMSVYLLQKDNY